MLSFSYNKFCPGYFWSALVYQNKRVIFSFYLSGRTYRTSLQKIKNVHHLLEDLPCTEVIRYYSVLPCQDTHCYMVFDGLATRMTVTRCHGEVGRVYYTGRDLILISFLYCITWLLLGCVLNILLYFVMKWIIRYTCLLARFVLQINAQHVSVLAGHHQGLPLYFWWAIELHTIPSLTHTLCSKMLKCHTRNYVLVYA
jgi:hypothetical protein